MMDEATQEDIDAGLDNLANLADQSMARYPGDMYMVIDELTTWIKRNSTHREAAGFASFAILRLKGYL